ncbi:hypothetical protein ABMA27_014199 [Loxostege sticticalis]|uniref:C-type lectin domain-containing protein n=1 Tax=Loxostege sticticalis TaxID=481309 RepID=A0ABR3ID25_LOXSC
MGRCALLLIIFAYTASGLPEQKRYREDYVYSADTDAFYKLHVDGASHDKAASICQAEGADLMVPTSIQQIAQVHGMLKQFPDIGDYVWVGDDGEAHESAEETPLINLQPEENDKEDEWYKPREYLVLSRAGEIETYLTGWQPLPFVCKVDAKSAPYDPNCDVYATGYEYKSTVGSCYKIPNVALSWNAAFAECKAEGAHLVVLNSEAERDVVKTMMNAAPRLRDSYHSSYYIAGIRANKPTDGTPRVFRTIFNQTLEEAGYSEWADTEPNNLFDSEYCGSLFENDGKYNDHNCANQYGFICEKEKRIVS